MEMDGESSSLTPILLGSGENAALGEVSAKTADVTQLDCAPEADVDQPDGKDGAVTPSKFSASGARIWPRPSEYVAVPRFARPSWSCRTGMMLSPQVPLAVKLNA